jgi:hypothetical protein
VRRTSASAPKWTEAQLANMRMWDEAGAFMPVRASEQLASKKSAPRRGKSLIETSSVSR